MDPNNPVVRLCAQGMEAESDGRPQDASALSVGLIDVLPDNPYKEIVRGGISNVRARLDG
jgi:hypothetical protein